jgi:hypothetical protein
MRKLKLTVNRRETRICRVPTESFAFLGYSWVGVIRRKQEQSMSEPNPRALVFRKILTSSVESLARAPLSVNGNQ